MNEFRNLDQIKSFLSTVDGWLSEDVSLYLMGGAAMTARQIKPRTDDIDFGFSTEEHFQHVLNRFLDNGFLIAEEPTESIEGVGRTIKMYNHDAGVEVDIFERQVVGKVWITDRMRERADAFWTGERIEAHLLSEADIFLLKAVSGGDLGVGRRTDIDDLLRTAQAGIDWNVLIEEIVQQRPFNTGRHEARLLRDGSHPLLAIDISVSHLNGLPDNFTKKVTQLGTDAQVERTVLQTIDDGTTEPKTIREGVSSSVAILDEDESERVTDAIERLVEKDVLQRCEGSLHLAE